MHSNLQDYEARFEFGISDAAKTQQAKRASVDRPEFVISLGDNFYVSGVTDLQDPAFQVTFEEVYKVTGLTDVPWWLVLGDHDHCGNISAQILYSEVRSWPMPFSSCTSLRDAISR